MALRKPKLYIQTLELANHMPIKFITTCNLKTHNFLSFIMRRSK